MPRKEKAVEVSHHLTARTNQIQLDFRSTATKVQLAVMIQKLRLRPHHTLELRREGIAHPAGRVQDLLKRGYVIDSSRVNAVDSDGYVHVGIAMYALTSEPEVQHASN